MNKVILMGRLTRDPEVRYSQGEQATAIARYTINANSYLFMLFLPPCGLLALCSSCREQGYCISRFSILPYFYASGKCFFKSFVFFSTIFRATMI